MAADTSAASAAANMDESMAADNGGNGEEVKLKLAQLERENYVLKEQVNDFKTNVDKFSKENDALKGANQALEKAALEKSNMYIRIDKERETLLVDKAQWQSENTQLRHQKEQLEFQTTRLLNEKRSLTEDIASLKNDYQKALNKIAKFQTEIDDFQSEKVMLQHDKERWAQEKELYSKNREWYMNELGDREKTISTLRLKIVHFERELSNKSAEFGNSIDDLMLQNESLGAKLTDLEDECKDLRELKMQLTNEKNVAVENISNELRVKDRLISTYKAEIENLKLEIEAFKNDEDELRSALTDKDEALIAVNEANKHISEEARDQVADRELKIITLQDELDKANDLLKFGGGNAFPGGADLSSFSATAASAAELLSSGTSLTSLYAQHCKVLGELTEERQKREHMEEYVRSLVADLKKNAPNILQIRKDYDIANAENEELRRQLKTAFEDRNFLRNEFDNITRELKFTRTELLSAQSLNSTLTKQVQKLLYVADNSGTIDPDVSANDIAVFSNIRELHEQNINLIQQLEEMKRSNEESIRQAKQEELESLHNKLSEFTHEIEILRDSQEKTSLIINQLEKQRDGYKAEVERLQHRSPLKALNNSRNFVDQESNNNEWKIKYEKFEQKFHYIVDDKQKTEEALNNRVDSQMELISQLRLTNGRLESDLEYQKKNQETAFKKVNELEKEISKKTDLIAKHKAQLDSDQKRIDQVTNELLTKQDELTRIKVDYHLLTEKYDVARNNANLFEAQCNVLRETRSSNERMNLTLEGLENLLKANEHEKLEQLKSQLDVITVERDNYRNVADDLRTNAERRNSELHIAHSEAIAAKDKLQIELKYQREQYAILQEIHEKTKQESEEAAKKLDLINAADVSVDGLNKDIQQLRNKNLYLEKQLSDQRMQLDQLQARLQAKDKELEELQRLTGGFESTMKSQDELQKHQQTSLQSQCDELTAELESAKRIVDELTIKVFQADESESKHNHAMDSIRQEYQNQLATLQKMASDAQAEVEEKKQKINEILISLQQAQSERDNVDARVKMLDDQLVSAENQISELKAELKVKNEQFETASNDHETIVNRLRNSVVLLEKEKARLNEEMKDLQNRDQEQKLNMNTLYDKIQALTQDNLLSSSQLDTSSSGALDNSSLQQTSTSTSDNTLTTVIDILRKIKDKEMEMRMAAEIELSRIKAQAHIDEQRIHELTHEIDELKKQVQTNAQLTIERNELLDRLGSLQIVQRKAAELENELKSTRQNATGLTQANARLQHLNTDILQAKNAIDQKCSTITQELFQVKKDLIDARQRCNELEKQIAQGATSTNAADSAKMAQLTAERDDLLNKQKATLATLTQVRKVARDYRDKVQAFESSEPQLKAQIAQLETEKTKLQEEVATSSANAAIPAGGPQTPAVRKALHEWRQKATDANKRADELKQENEGLKKQLEELEAKASQSSELNLRLNSITNQFSMINQKTEKQKAELKQLDEERNRLVEENEKLKAEIASLNAAIVVASAPPPAITQPQPTPQNVLESSGAAAANRKRSAQEDADTEMDTDAKRRKSDEEQQAEQSTDSQQGNDVIADDILDVGEPSNDVTDRPPSMEEGGVEEEHMEEDNNNIVPEEESNLDFEGSQDYGDTQESENYPEPPNFVHEENNDDDEPYEDYENSGLPIYPQDEDEDAGAEDLDDDDEEAEEIVEDDDDDQDDVDVHSDEHDEGDSFNMAQGNDDEEDDDDDDIIVMN